MKEPLRLPTGDFTGTSGKVLGVLLGSHCPSARINVRPEKVWNIIKIGNNGINWLKAEKVVLRTG